jgi:hypothetical protein
MHVGRACRLGAVTYFPLWSDAPLGSALSTGEHCAVVVEEIPDRPVVETLVVTNPSETAVLLVEGELLEGDGSTAPSNTTSCSAPASGARSGSAASSKAGGTARRSPPTGPGGLHRGYRPR